MQNSPVSGGASVTVYGLSFGTEETTVSTGLDSVSCQTSTWTGSTIVRCLMADMQAGVSLMLSAAGVTVGGISGTQNAMLRLSFDAPTLSQVCRSFAWLLLPLRCKPSLQHSGALLSP
jgi:hypothetical protein